MAAGPGLMHRLSLFETHQNNVPVGEWCAQCRELRMRQIYENIKLY